ncbi:hypothetical protein V6N12_070458 [Hibiscus sabdariffa]|uniref:Methyltransferase type 11 domain-containing protein n=1 Tax=Hibiscus sabdariffa TaxID=183260 RepID=A0ABR2FGW2_9ROSI
MILVMVRCSMEGFVLTVEGAETMALQSGNGRLTLKLCRLCYRFCTLFQAECMFHGTKMERNIQSSLNKVSFVSISIATLITVLLFLQTPKAGIPPSTTQKPRLRFPNSTCDSTPRRYLPLSKKNARLWSSKSWMTQVSSFTQFFTQLHQMGLLKQHSKVLCVSAGAGHEVMSLSKMGLEDVKGVELIESLPLVSRANPHNLPFSDEAFDVAFSSHLMEALYPMRYAGEMERTVRKGGLCVVVVDECGEEEVKEIVSLFRQSRLLGSSNVTLNGRRVTRIIMRHKSY